MRYMSKSRKVQVRKAALISVGGIMLGAGFFVPSAQADYPTYSNSVNRSQATSTSGWKLEPAAGSSRVQKGAERGLEAQAGAAPAIPPATSRKTLPVLEKEPPPERRSTFGNFGMQNASPKRVTGAQAERALEVDAVQTKEPVSSETPGGSSMSLPNTSGSPGSSGFKLRAGVSHSEVMAPVPPAQRPGHVYRANAYVAGGTRAKVFKIPDWIAGVWQRSEAKEIARTQLPSGKSLKPVGNQVARVKDVFGTYRDRNGQVWQTFNPSKASGQIDRGSNMDYQRVHSYDLVITGPKSLVVEVQASHTLVNKANRQIQRVYQDEELNTYTLLPDGKLKTDSSVKVFDMDGKPFLLTRSVSTEIRVPPKNWPPRANSPMRGN